MRRTRWFIVPMALALIAAACGGSDSGTTTGTAAPATTAAAPATAATDAPEEMAAFDIDAVLAVDMNSCAAAPTGDAIKIGFAADLSDLGGFADGPASQAAGVFADMINCSGGVNGSPIEVIVQNIEGNPEVTQRAAQDLLDAGVLAILGPPFPDFGLPLLQAVNAQVPVLFVASTEPTLPDASISAFLVAFDDTAQATAAAQFALDKGWSTAVTFSSPGPYFGYNPEIFTQVFEEGGGEVIGDYNYVPIEDVDFSTQANEVAALDRPPEVLYTAMLAFQAAILRGQLEGVGVETNYLITDAFEATGGYFEEGVEGFYHTTHSFPAEGSRLVRFGEVFAEQTGAEIENLSFGGLAVDAMAVVIDGYLAAGSMDPAAISAAIAELTGVEGTTGTISYAGTMGSPIKPVYVHQVVDGQPTLAATIG